MTKDIGAPTPNFKPPNTAIQTANNVILAPAREGVLCLLLFSSKDIGHSPYPLYDILLFIPLCTLEYNYKRCF